MSQPESPLVVPAPAAIGGIGMDLLRIDRIERALARHGDRFAEKILGPEELAKFHARRARDPVRGVRFLATRFAAKEAFSKAVGLGMRMPMTWRRVQTLNAPGGRPVLVIAPNCWNGTCSASAPRTFPLPMNPTWPPPTWWSNASPEPAGRFARQKDKPMAKKKSRRYRPVP